MGLWEFLTTVIIHVSCPANSRGFGQQWVSAIDISTMADVDDEDQQLLLMHQVDNPITAYAIRVTTFEFPLQGFTLERIAFKVIQGVGHTRIQSRFPLCHAPDDALGLIGELQSIDGQGMP